MVGGGLAWAVTQLGGDDEPAGKSEDPGQLGQASAPPASPVNSPAASLEPTVPLDEQCTDQIRANERWVCLTSATMVDGQLVIEFEAEWAGQTPAINGGYHVHIYGSDGTNPPDEVMGVHAAHPGQWLIYDQNPIIIGGPNDFDRLGDRPEGLRPDRQRRPRAGACPGRRLPHRQLPAHRTGLRATGGRDGDHRHARRPEGNPSMK